MTKLEKGPKCSTLNYCLIVSYWAYASEGGKGAREGEEEFFLERDGGDKGVVWCMQNLGHHSHLVLSFCLSIIQYF